MTPYEQTLVLLLTAGVPVSTIDPQTIRYHLEKEHKTPVEIALKVWNLRPDQLRTES